MSYFVRIVNLLTDPTDTVGYGLNTESSVLLTFVRLLTCGCMSLTRLDVVPTVVAHDRIPQSPTTMCCVSFTPWSTFQRIKKKILIAKSSLWVDDAYMALSAPAVGRHHVFRTDLLPHSLVIIRIEWAQACALPHAVYVAADFFSHRKERESV